MSDTMCAKTTETNRCQRCGSEFDWLSDGTKIHAGKRYFESDSLLCLERQLNVANQRIQSLIEERDRANRLAEWKWNLRGEFQSLLGTDNIEEGIKAVKALMSRIKRLEEAGDAMERCSDAVSADNWHKAKEAKP